MYFDEILKHYLGEFGPYQILLIICVGGVGINVTFDVLDYLFTAAVPEFWCNVGNITHLTANLTKHQMISLTSPIGEDGKYDTCSMYVRNYTTMTIDEAYQDLANINKTVDIVPCSRWIFSTDQYISTIASQWGLVCDREWLLATTQAVFMAGKFTISITGWLMDRFGRKKILLSAMCLHIVFRITMGLSVNIYMFMVSRFFLSVSSGAWYTASFFICVEMVGEKWRVLAGQAVYFFWSIGYMILAGMAYFIRDWKTLTMALLGFTAPFLLHFWFLPESIRWLHSTNKCDEAFSVMNSIAKLNKTKLPPKEEFEQVKVSKDKPRIVDLFNSAKQIRILLVLSFEWICITFLYSGLIYYLPQLGGNIYISTVISGALELPSLIYIQLTLNTRLGRRLNTAVTFIAGGLALLILVFLKTDVTWIKIGLALIGRFATSATFSIVYIHTAELFPTPVRSLGFAFCSTAGRIGSVTAPYVTLMRKLGPQVPPTFMGVIAILCGLLSLTLPETNGKPLPETFKHVGKQHDGSQEMCKTPNGIKDEKETQLISKPKKSKPTDII